MNWKNETQQVKDEAAAALAGDNLSADELQALGRKVAAQASAVRARIAAIRPQERNNPAGPERRKALQAGDSDAAKRLQDEHADALLAAESLDAQQRALNDRRHAAIAREAAERLPSMFEQLQAEAEAVEGLAAELEQRRTGMMQLTNQCMQARSHATKGGHKAAAASPELAQRVIASVPAMQRMPRDYSERLGADIDAREAA